MDKLSKSKAEFLCKQFNIVGDVVDVSRFTSGHINDTYLVKVVDGEKVKSYVLQKINKYVYKDPILVMENIKKITKHIERKLTKNKQNIKGKVLKYFETKLENNFYIDENQEFWRMCNYIEETISYDRTNDLYILEQTSKAFGNFQNQLADYPIEKLNITIPHFHNTIDRYHQFEESIKKDTEYRVKEVVYEIKEFMNLKDIATKMYKLQKCKKLPLRVTHNDTKVNNVLFDRKTNKHLCVIDLDTVMPGLVGFDFGDAVRFGASSSKEDFCNLDEVFLDLEKFKALTKGFLKEVGNNLINTEVKTLALGAVTMTIECGVRYLTDYLNGDKYFRTEYKNQNKIRAQNHLALAKDMIDKYEEMKNIINYYYQLYSKQTII